MALVKAQEIVSSDPVVVYRLVVGRRKEDSDWKGSAVTENEGGDDGGNNIAQYGRLQPTTLFSTITRRPSPPARRKSSARVADWKARREGAEGGVLPVVFFSASEENTAWATQRCREERKIKELQWSGSASFGGRGREK
ncbi:hypothetical protein KSP40_PGU008701 [Platanthera guangdongensis]|uniref:Uncharacterized protein n=1 Tax=Platanthera guangdongensis TaxID=2320717 RepID=A0ABR2M5R6_9ASPA